MLSENDRFRDFLGVTAWHKAGYTGKRGLTASAENFAVGTGHPYDTHSIFKEIAPDRETTYSPMIGTTAIKNSIEQIMSRKVDTMFDANFLETSGAFLDELLEPTTPFLFYAAAAGNHNDNEYCGYLDCKYIYGVGAYLLMYGTNEIVPASYSSETDEVDFSTPTGLFVQNPDGSCGVKFAGTSCADPVLVGLAALVNDFFIDKTGKPLSSATMYQFFKDNAVDISVTGKDSKTGWGAVKLPDPATVDIGRYAGTMYSSRNIDDLRPDVAANCHKFVALCKEAGYPVLVTGTVRDDEYQALCFYNGTSKSALPSFHSVKAGLAFDICKNVKGQEYSDNAFWAGVGAIGQKMGFNWGGAWTSFVDKPHFQWSDHGKYTSSMIRAGNYPPTMPLYEEDEDMTQDTFNALYDKANPLYKTVDDVPESWRYETRSLISSGKLKGDGTGNINIRHETLRAAIIAAR